jgi:L-threonylcarbamoyladenylate synthase
MTQKNDMEAAVAALAAGLLVAFPTETVYGLGADATSDRAVARVYEAKGRPSFNPLIVHVADLTAATAIGLLTADAMRLAEAFWPGPLTLVVRRTQNCAVSLLASSGLDTIAIRIPRHDLALDLLRRFAKPVVAPSANPSGRVSPTTATHVARYLTDKVAVILDGGPCTVGLESTVVACLDNQRPVLLRPGGTPRAAVEGVLGRALRVPGVGGPIRSPGQLASHYAPKAAMRLNVLEPEAGETFVGFGSLQNDPGFNLSPTGDVVEAAANLFGLLHKADDLGTGRIAVAPIPMAGLGEAINDRLLRAAAPRSEP